MNNHQYDVMKKTYLATEKEREDYLKRMRQVRANHAVEGTTWREDDYQKVLMINLTSNTREEADHRVMSYIKSFLV